MPPKTEKNNDSLAFWAMVVLLAAAIIIVLFSWEVVV
jgi:hypothetical protein